VESRARGRIAGPLRACFLVLEGQWTWYRRGWKATAMVSVGLPVLYLIAMGVGLGSQIRAPADLGGVSYLAYIAPGVLVISAIQNAAAESTYPILSGLKWQRTFTRIVTSPITPDQLLAALLIWIMLRIVSAGGIYLLCAAAVGALTGPMALVSLVFATVCGMSFAAPLVAWSTTRNDEGQSFNLVSRFVVVPMTLFAGAMFPAGQLPEWVQVLAWLTPMWHGVELARGVEFGSLSWWPSIGHVAYLVTLFICGTLVARVKFRARLTH
jgi:lipooligosaccharide transport system permease protein